MIAAMKRVVAGLIYGGRSVALGTRVFPGAGNTMNDMRVGAVHVYCRPFAEGHVAFCADNGPGHLALIALHARIAILAGAVHLRVPSNHILPPYFIYLSGSGSAYHRREKIGTVSGYRISGHGPLFSVYPSFSGQFVHQPENAQLLERLRDRWPLHSYIVR